MTLLDSASATGDSRLHGAHALFEAIAGLPPRRQHERLRELTCDAQTIAMVEDLLDAHTRSLDSLGASLSTAVAASPDTELSVGDTLGAWKLVECLASGGMGTVFIAERADRLYTQRVAIKLMRGQPDAATTERMAAERQLLAQLQHPGIARLYDGGTTPAGQPYLVMEYVDGLSLLHYCREQRPGLQQRIGLFQSVCRIVECAHRHMIVHCDLKPGNILVRADGEPVLLDFGIARGLGSGVERGGFCTPAYASPELLAGRPVSTASDVFSLGVVLIELLAAQRVPRDQDNREQPLPAPSRLAGDDATGWRGQLRGDLDAIAAKACALDPAQRYSTVAELHEDLQRYREHRPVLARAPSPGYRLHRLLRRRWREAAVLAGLSMLVAGFVWRLDDERRAAYRAAQTAEQVSDMLASSFAAADPKRGKGNTELSAREVLDAGAASLDSKEIRDPAVLARLREVLGYAYHNLGQPQLAEPLMIASIDGYLDPTVRNPTRAAKVLSDLAVLRGNSGRDKEAIAAARRSLALREQIGAGPVEIADALNSLGITLVDADREEAERVLARSLELRRRHVGEPSTAVAATLHNLGMLQRHREDFVGAEDFYRKSLAMKRALGLADNANYEYSLSGLAQSLRGQGRLAEAADLQRDALKLALRLYGDGTGVGTAYNELANTLHDLGRWPDAARYYAASERLAAASAGEDSIDFAISLNNHASLNEDRGAIAAAERGFRRSLAIRSAQLDADNPSVLRARFNLGRLLLREGRLVEAGALIESAWGTWQRNNDPGEPGSIGHRLLVAEWLVAAGRTDEAAREVRAIAAIGPDRPKRLAWLHSLQGALSAAAGNRNAALDYDRQALQTMVGEFGAQHVEAARHRLGYADRLAAAGDSVRARAELDRAVAVLAPQLAPNAPLWTRIRALQASLGPTRHVTSG
ncbi:MAG: protein kinase domain-containing protein [Lysobacter sp.]